MQTTATPTPTATLTATGSNECAMIEAQVPESYVSYGTPHQSVCSSDDVLKILPAWCHTSGTGCGIIVCDEYVPPEYFAAVDQVC
jgi:hypothetical protein